MGGGLVSFYGICYSHDGFSFPFSKIFAVSAAAVQEPIAFCGLLDYITNSYFFRKNLIKDRSFGFVKLLCEGTVMKREYPENPLVGVGAVIFVGKKVLLARRNKMPGQGQWSLPGGAVELGETLLDGLRRELREELCVEIEVGGLVGVFDRIICDRKDRVQYHYVLIDYWGRIASGQPRPASDISEVRLFTLEELETCGIDRELRETVLKAAEICNKSKG
jgi:ADP-ribose pyrophosphatase YjhB (NUDIX family)